MKNTNLPSKDRVVDQLQRSINIVDYFIRRDYLADLSKCEVAKQTHQDTKLIRMFHLNKLVLDSAKNIGDKLISIYSAVQNVGASIILLIKGSKDGISFYFGARAEESAVICEEVLTNSFKANFPGSEIQSFDDNKIQEILSEQCFDNICSVTAIPSKRDPDKDNEFVQGIEKFIDTMQGNEYSALFISKPVKKYILNQRRAGLERLYSSLSPYAKTTLAYAENQSEAVSKGHFENFSSTVNESISNTLGENWSVSSGSGRNYNGLLSSTSYNKSKTHGYSSSETTSHGTADTKGYGSNDTTTDTYGSSKTVTKEIVDKNVEDLLQYIDEQIERSNQFASFGAFETAAYFYSKRIEVSIIAASTFKALICGDDTNAENAFLNIWDHRNSYTFDVAQSLKNCCHPVFKVQGFDSFAEQYVTPGNYLSSKELPILMGVPYKSVAGLPVSKIAEFDRNVSLKNSVGNAENTRTLPLGYIHHMGVDEKNNKVELDINSFASHCFITGSTGSGKSNTTYWLISNFIRENIPFLVIEPAKGEYRTEFGSVKGINVFTTNPYHGSLLKINPFTFNAEKIHILEHLDKLVEIFNSSWELYAAMPAILKSAIEKAYSDKGWDLINSIYLHSGKAVFPTFSDILNALPQIISNTSYSADSKGDYSGALVTRVRALTNGINGQIFCDNYSIDDRVLFDENTIIDLSRIGSNETKALIMGVLVMKLTEFRTAYATGGGNHKLKHVTILEEAHNLLKRVNKDQGQQTANLVGKSVEMLCNSIAEMRTYGEGFIIVDQSPSSVDIAAIKNTNTKIVHRLPEKSDCESIGNSLGLSEDQIVELTKLPIGVAAVLQSNWAGTVLCHVNKAYSKFYCEHKVNSFEQIKRLRSAVLETILTQFSNDKKLNLDKLREIVLSVDISDAAQKEMLDRLRFISDLLENQINDTEKYVFYFRSILHLSGALGVFTSCESYIIAQEEEVTACQRWKQQLMEQLNRLFIFTNTGYYEFLLERLLFAMRWYSTDVNYKKIYSTLYEQE